MRHWRNSRSDALHRPKNFIRPTMKEVIHEFPTETIYLNHDKKHLTSCQQCKLHKPSCGDICMTAGTRYHVSKVIRYSWFKSILRFFILKSDYLSKRYLWNVSSNPHPSQLTELSAPSSSLMMIPFCCGMLARIAVTKTGTTIPHAMLLALTFMDAGTVTPPISKSFNSHNY